MRPFFPIKFLFVSLALLSAAGFFFAGSFLFAQTSVIDLDKVFECAAGDTPEAGEFVGKLSANGGTKNTAPLSADRTFGITCRFNTDDPILQIDPTLSDTAQATARVMRGTLSCGAVTHNSVTVNYTYINGTDVRLLRDGAVVAPSLGSGSVPPNQKSFPDPGLLPNKSYTYILQSKDSDGVYQKLAEISCATPLPITATLECKDPKTGEWKQDYCVVNYGQQPELKWTTNGNPSKCRAGVDWSGDRNPKGGILRFFLSSLGKSGDPFHYRFNVECER